MVFSILYRNDVFEKKNELHKVMCFKVLLKYLTKLILLSGEKITYILMETMKKFVWEKKTYHEWHLQFK